MDRKAIKAKAKEMLKGNLWKLLWPMLVIGCVSSVISTIAGPSYTYNTETMEFVSNGQTAFGSLLSFVGNMLTAILTVGYAQYLLNFVRGKEFDFNTIIETVKKKWLVALLTALVGGILMGIGFVLLIVPGVILWLMFAMTDYLICDKELTGIDPLKESKELMDGHKGDYFVFCLSFIGWVLLGLITFGIAWLYAMPYFNVAEALYYEELKKLK